MARPCEPGPEVMRPLADLAEAREILADLLARGRLEIFTAPAYGGGRITYAGLWAGDGAHLTRVRAGETLDEALRALHRAVMHRSSRLELD